MNIRPFIILSAFILLFGSCGEKKKLFTAHTGPDVGIDFQNAIIADDSLNALTFEYIYNGSGVGVGDFNNDGLPDLFFGGNQVSSKLYINKGNLQFEDVTEKAGVSTTKWVTGVSVVDINRDGYQDVFLSVAGKTTPEDRRDLLFINQGVKDGVPVFTESAKAFGLDDDSYSTQGAFFDYDKDGDLDLYLVNNWLESFNRNNLRPKRVHGEAESTDKFFRNNGDNTFTDVSEEAGITIEGYGLGVAISDLNRDSWPDVYVSNDFMSNDLIWINQQNGTFKNMAGEYLKHQTHNAMGIDIADFNNDELADIMIVDMLPPGHVRQKMMTPGQNYDHFHMSQQMGYQAQYMRNTLQLNRGYRADGTPIFSEIAFMSGVAKTDWSWAPLFADLDNDGWKDLFIANGYRKDVTDLDFIFFGIDTGSPFGTPEARGKRLNQELAKVADVKLSNYVFRNTGSLVFEDKSKDWGFDDPTFSNGAAYADLDNDGDLDLITNNIDQPVILYENLSDKQVQRPHYLNLHCADTGVFNQKIWIYAQGKTQYQELTPYRGFQSTVTTDIHFGLGQINHVDSVKIEWTDNSRAIYYNIDADTTIVFSHNDTRALKPAPASEHAPVFFDTVDVIAFKHHETSPSDIKVTRTLLHELAQAGPCMAAADVNGDSLDDLFIGGEWGTSPKLFIQRTEGDFILQLIETDSLHEDGAAHFFDADGDGDPDLYVAGSCRSSQAEAGPHRLFINDGKGHFAKMPGALPDILASSSCVISNDYDGDGDLDLFVAGKLKPNEYPLSPRSFVLQNDHGKFSDVTAKLNAGLEYPGLVSSAVWADIDNDKKSDLIVAGEWMPVRVFKNQGSSFKEITDELGLEKSNGWWNCIKAEDLNNDGYPEIIAGNTGMNSYFQPTAQEPVSIIAKDFDKNGSMDPLITYYNPVEKDRFIVHNRLVLIDQIPGIKKRFQTFRKYASTPFSKVFTAEELAGAYTGNAFTLRSALFINEQGKKLTRKDMPEIAQASSINDILADDLNDDGHVDLILIGNTYAQETLFGQYDASIGTILLGDGKMNWRSIEPVSANMVIDSDAKFINRLRTAQGKLFVITNNSDRIQSFLLKKAK